CMIDYVFSFLSTLQVVQLSVHLLNNFVYFPHIVECRINSHRIFRKQWISLMAVHVVIIIIIIISFGHKNMFYYIVNMFINKLLILLLLFHPPIVILPERRSFIHVFMLIPEQFLVFFYHCDSNCGKGLFYTMMLKVDLMQSLMILIKEKSQSSDVKQSALYVSRVVNPADSISTTSWFHKNAIV
ncbi:hypothetical protein L9F63_019129, partial [Diploptera punctata]